MSTQVTPPPAMTETQKKRLIIEQRKQIAALLAPVAEPDPPMFTTTCGELGFTPVDIEEYAHHLPDEDELRDDQVQNQIDKAHRAYSDVIKAKLMKIDDSSMANNAEVYEHISALITEEEMLYRWAKRNGYRW